MDRRHDDGQNRASRAARPRGWRITSHAIRARAGQSTLEFALVVPLFILLVLAIYAFGTLFEAKISLDNAVRDAARYGSQYATRWDATSASPAPNTIEGRLINSGGIASITNSTSNIQITYSTVNTSTTPYTTSTCGSVPTVPSTCETKGNMITVSAKINYQIPLPVVSNIIRIISKNGVPMQSSVSMMIEQ
jgi:Flp pilus assembly protein TadG